MELGDALNKFGAGVVKDAKNNLKRYDKDNGALENSLSYKVNVSKNSFQLDIYAEKYWTYVDYGVKGVGGTKADGTQWKVKKVNNSKYKYKSKMPPTRVFNMWTVKKGIAPRNKKGQFQTRKGLMFAIAKSVYHTGIETTGFLTTPFNNQFNKLPEEVVLEYALTVENLLKTTLKSM